MFYYAMKSCLCIFIERRENIHRENKSTLNEDTSQSDDKVEKSEGEDVIRKEKGSLREEEGGEREKGEEEEEEEEGGGEKGEEGEGEESSEEDSGGSDSEGDKRKVKANTFKVLFILGFSSCICYSKT